MNRVAAGLALGLALGACEPRTTRVAGVTVELHTPADVDPLDGAASLVVQVRDASGAVVERVSGTPDEGVPVPLVTVFDPVTIEVLATDASGAVLSAARSGPVRVRPDDQLSLSLLFLPVNQAVPLGWTPNADRVGHTMVPLPSGEVLLVGGRSPGSALARRDSELWSIELGFAGEGPVLPEGVSNAASATFPQGGTLIAGGDANGAASSVVLSVSRDGETISEMADLRDRALEPCAAPLVDRGVVAFTPSTVELYTPINRADDADIDVSGVSACAGSQDIVVTAGDSDRWGVIDLTGGGFDIATSATWFPGLPSLDDPHVVALPDGTFWIGGGYGFEASAITRRVIPTRLEIVEGSPLANPRTDGHADVLSDGTVVLAGGWSDDVKTAAVRSVDLHHPDDGPLLSIPVPVREPSMAILSGDVILLTGGLDDEGEGAGAYAVLPWTDSGGDDG